MSTVNQATPHPARSAKPIMTLALDSEGPATLITVRGEVDMSNAHLVNELAEHAIARRPAHLVLDLSRVTFFSAHGVSALLRTHDAATRARVPLTLHDPAPCVTHLLTATGTTMSWDGSTAASALGHHGVDPLGRLSPRPRVPTADGYPWQAGRRPTQMA
ncbi:STAS domain-containing protein [Micromonospora sp. NPDC049497]|uniref:STAS domain-containing protein n=1 Tax=Micromonospora sp. NPDC049497 TaxID=3364273 RepID=UPI003799016A